MLINFTKLFTDLRENAERRRTKSSEKRKRGDKRKNEIRITNSTTRAMTAKAVKIYLQMLENMSHQTLPLKLINSSVLMVLTPRKKMRAHQMRQSNQFSPAYQIKKKRTKKKKAISRNLMHSLQNWQERRTQSYPQAKAMRLECLPIAVVMEKKWTWTLMELWNKKRKTSDASKENLDPSQKESQKI